MENGLTLLLGFAAGMTVLSFGANMVESRGGSVIELLSEFIFTAPLVFVFLVCLIAFAGGLGLAGWSAFTYLKYGYWPQPNGFAILRALDVPDVPYSGWTGFDHIVTSILSLPAAPTIVVGSVAVVATVGVLLTFAFSLRR